MNFQKINRVSNVQLEDIIKGENYGIECDEWNNTSIHDIVNDLIEAREALAEFEKPADMDAVLFAERLWREAYSAKYGDVNLIAAKIIQQFAESYHQRKCAECVK